MKNGYYLQIDGFEYFFITDAKKKTRKLIEEILNKLCAPVNENNVAYLVHNLLRANLEVKSFIYPSDLGGEYAGKRREYYNIFGENFSGYGSFVDDGKTVIIHLDGKENNMERVLVKRGLMFEGMYLGSRFIAYKGGNCVGSIDVVESVEDEVVNTDIMDGIPLVTEGDIELVVKGDKLVSDGGDSVREITTPEEWVFFIRNVLQG